MDGDRRWVRKHTRDLGEEDGGEEDGREDEGTAESFHVILPFPDFTLWVICRINSMALEAPGPHPKFFKSLTGFKSLPSRWVPSSRLPHLFVHHLLLMSE